MNSAEIAQLVTAVVVLAVWGMIFIFVLALALFDHRRLKEHYKTGLAVGLYLFMLLVPSLVFGLVYFDAQAFAEQMEHRGASRELVALALRAGPAFRVLLQVLRIGWYMIVYCVAASEWERVRPGAPPLLRGAERGRAAPLMGALALGMVVGVASTVVFRVLQVDIGEVLKNVAVMFPGAESASLATRVPIFLMTLATIAVAEELLFRGVLFGFLLRVCGSGRLAVLLSAIVVSFVWAILHAQSTDAPLVKCTQIFIVGLILCWLARKGNVESAIAAHVGLNLAAGVAALAI